MLAWSTQSVHTQRTILVIWGVRVFGVLVRILERISVRVEWWIGVATCNLGPLIWAEHVPRASDPGALVARVDGSVLPDEWRLPLAVVVVVVALDDHPRHLVRGTIATRVHLTAAPLDQRGGRRIADQTLK
jgi:hypothetical protein